MLSVAIGFHLLPSFLPVHPPNPSPNPHIWFLIPFFSKESEAQPKAMSIKHRGQRDFGSILQDASVPSSVPWNCNGILRDMKI